MEERQHICPECSKPVSSKWDLTWVKDLYGIPFKKVCMDCYDTVSDQILNNHYGDELTHDELYGEDY